MSIQPLMHWSRIHFAGVFLALAGAGHAASAPAVVSFRNDVMPVLSKAGCSAGTCHGNKYGKGGFKISLRNQDPELDWISVTRDASAAGTRGNRTKSPHKPII